MAAVAEAEAEEVPMGHRGGAPLYGRMMKAIQTGHSFGNRVRMLKLPLIFLEPNLYAEAIAQFYWLSSTLELKLADHEAHPMIAKVKALNLCVTPGYESDLRELFGEGASHPIDLCIVAAYRLPKHPIIGGSSLSCTDWRRVAERKRTAATTAYVKILESADAVSLTAAAFILYGALVVGGGKMTQRKVRKVLPGCQHALFDVADDMKSARQHFKNTFTAIGKEHPEHFATLEAEAARFMALNNTVVLSVRCWGLRATAVLCGAAAVCGAVVVAVRALRST